MPTAAHGSGIWAEEGAGKIGEVLAGSRAEHSIRIYSDTGHLLRMRLLLTGQINGFAELNTSSVEVLDSRPGEVTLLIEPEGILPGEYSGYLFISSVTEMGFGPSAMVPLRITVTEDEKTDASIKEIYIPDTPEGEDTGMDILVENTGNTIIDMVIKVDILDSERRAVLMTLVDSEEDMAAGESRHVRMSVPAGLDPGKYYARTELKDGNLTFRRDIVGFWILRMSGERSPGTVKGIDASLHRVFGDTDVVIEGEFLNTGIVPLDVSLIAVVESGGALVRVIESEKKEVAPGRSMRFETTFTPEQRDRFNITSYFEAGGLRTEGKRIEMNIYGTGRTALNTSGLFIFGIVVLYITFRFLVNKWKEEERDETENMIEINPP